MPTSSRTSLAIGVVAGVFLALILHPFILSTQLPLPTQHTRSTDSLPRASAPHSPFDHMAALLKNTLQMAAQAGRAAGGYKSGRLLQQTAARSSPLSSSTTAIPSIASPISHSSSRAFSSTQPTMAASKSFLDAVKERRTFYQLNKEAPISDKQVVDIVNTTVLSVPSSFNSQSARLVVLLNKEHEQFWDITHDVLKAIVPAEQFGTTEKKIAGFRAAYGSILFFEDPEPVDNLRKAFPIFAHHFGDWSEHTSAMHQFALWTALEAEGFGANLQHYNPIVDQRVQEQWNVPKEWKLRAQLVFGGKANPGELSEKKQTELEKRVFVHGAKE